MLAGRFAIAVAVDLSSSSGELKELLRSRSAIPNSNAPDRIGAPVGSGVDGSRGARRRGCWPGDLID